MCPHVSKHDKAAASKNRELALDLVLVEVDEKGTWAATLQEGEMVVFG